MFDASHQSDSFSLICQDLAMTGCHDACMECSVRVLPIMSLRESALLFSERASCNYMAYTANTNTHTNEMMDNMLPWPAALPFPMQQMIWCFHTACLTSVWCGMRVIDWVAWGRVHFTVSSQTPPSSITTAYGFKQTPNCKHSTFLHRLRYGH